MNITVKNVQYEVIDGFRQIFPLSVTRLGTDLCVDFHSFINNRNEKWKNIREEVSSNAVKVGEFMKKRERPND
jgi:hypothetical protein